MFLISAINLFSYTNYYKFNEYNGIIQNLLLQVIWTFLQQIDMWNFRNLESVLYY